MSFSGVKCQVQGGDQQPINPEVQARQQEKFIKAVFNRAAELGGHDNPNDYYYLLYLHEFKAQEGAFYSHELPFGRYEGNLDIVVGEVAKTFGWQTYRGKHQIDKPEKFRNQLLFCGTAEELIKARFHVKVTELDQKDKTILNNAALVLDKLGGFVRTAAPPPYNLAGLGFSGLAVGASIAAALTDDDVQLEYRGRVPAVLNDGDALPAETIFTVSRDLDASPSKGELTVAFRLQRIERYRRQEGKYVANVRISVTKVHLPGTTLSNSYLFPKADEKYEEALKHFYSVGNHDSGSILQKIFRRVKYGALEIQAESTFGTDEDLCVGNLNAFYNYSGDHYLAEIVGVENDPVFQGTIDPFLPLPFSLAVTYQKHHRFLDAVLNNLGGIADTTNEIYKESNRQKAIALKAKLAKLQALEAEASEVKIETTTTLQPDDARKRKIEKLSARLADLESGFDSYIPAIKGSVQPLRNVVAEHLPDIKSQYVASNIFIPWTLSGLSVPADDAEPKSFARTVPKYTPVVFYIQFNKDTREETVTTQDPGELVRANFLRLSIEIDGVQESPSLKVRRLLHELEHHLSGKKEVQPPVPAA